MSFKCTGTVTLTLLFLLLSAKASAFCGFYVAKADTSLFNRASKVVMVRDDDKTVLTMANDFQGDVNEFATVIPVPEILERGQINVAEPKVLDHLDAYTAPRLVEYFDPDPCRVNHYGLELNTVQSRGVMKKMKGAAGPKRNYGVKIEAKYSVGEYDILILSAKESGGLLDWLTDNGYKVPNGAKPVLKSYIKQGLKFFVAKVNLEKHSKLGYTYLRPLQVAYQSKKFMLPIRLGMANAKEGESQELFVFALTKKGKVESVNYRTVEIPSNVEIPPYVKKAEVFSKFYKSMFDTAARREDNKVVFMEYAWDMGWCDPCAADPLSRKELKSLGVYWAGDDRTPSQQGRGGFMPPRGGGPVNVFVTRLHVRYNKDTFPDDIRFQVTSDKKNFQGRYILRHPFKGNSTCEAANKYQDQLLVRQEKENTTLAHLTGWDINEIRKERGMELNEKDTAIKKKKKWWQELWN